MHRNAVYTRLPPETHAWLRQHVAVCREVVAIELARPRAGRGCNQLNMGLAPAEAHRLAESLRRRRQKATVAMFSLYERGFSA